VVSDEKVCQSIPDRTARRGSNRLGGTRVNEKSQEIRRENKANKEESQRSLNFQHLSLLAPRSSSCCLIVQDYAQKRRVDLKAAVVLDEPELSEFVHEEIDP
jgi:hypothetical protein